MCTDVRTWLQGVLLSFLMLCNAHVSARSLEQSTRALPQLPAPPQTRMEWIARSMRMNGLPMTIASFDSSLPPTAVLQHYSHWWTTTDLGSRGTTQVLREGGWQTLALSSPRLLITVRATQVRSGSQGTVVVSPNPSQVTFRTTSTFPRPANAQILSLQEYDDAGTRAECISFSSPRPISIAAHEFTQRLLQSGWNVYRSHASEAYAPGHVLEAQRGSDMAQLTFTPGNTSGSHVTVIWKKA
jgi:hypothetical protein